MLCQAQIFSSVEDSRAEAAKEVEEQIGIYETRAAANYAQASG